MREYSYISLLIKKTPMKKQITKTLIALFIASAPASASIIYTDVNPDSVAFGNSTITWDMDNDGTKDFRITTAASGNIGFSIMQAGQLGTTNSVLVNGSNAALALNLNDAISASSTVWHLMTSNNPQMTLVNGSTVTGTWAGATDKYLGLKFVKASNTYYGWARLTVSGSSLNVVLKDFAYESTPNQQILAGATTTGFDKNVQDVLEVKTYPNPSSSLIKFSFKAQNGNMQLILSDMLGRKVKEISIKAGVSAAELSVAELPEGIYIYTLKGVNINTSGRIEKVD